jgi:hypothetical protein
LLAREIGVEGFAGLGEAQGESCDGAGGEEVFDAGVELRLTIAGEEDLDLVGAHIIEVRPTGFPEFVHVAEEFVNEGCGGVVVDFLGWADLFDAALMQDDHEVGEFEGLLLVVGDEDGGDANFLMEGSEPAAEVFADFGVEGAEGFIEEEDFRIDGEGARQGDALALAAGELGGQAVFQALELDEAEEFEDPVAEGLRRRARRGGPDSEAEGDVFEDGEVMKEGVVLEDEPGFAFGGGSEGDVFAVEMDLAVTGVREVEAPEDAQEGGFAGAGGAEEGDQLAVWDFEGKTAEGLKRAEGATEILDADGHGERGGRRA